MVLLDGTAFIEPTEACTQGQDDRIRAVVGHQIVVGTSILQPLRARLLQGAQGLLPPCDDGPVIETEQLAIGLTGDMEVIARWPILDLFPGVAVAVHHHVKHLLGALGILAARIRDLF